MLLYLYRANQLIGVSMKSNDTVIIESMAARIRELEGQLSQQQQSIDTKNDCNIGAKSTLSDFIREQLGADTLLDFERFIEVKLARNTSVQPDLLDAYLWVFEIAYDEGLLEPSAKNSLDEESSARLISNVRKYRAQLKAWENKTQA